MHKYLAIVKNIGKSRFVRNVLIVATGTAGAQAITMAFSPILTRLYGPEAFGMLGAFMAIVTIIDPIAALTYPSAIVLPKDNNEARGIARLSIIASVSIALIVAIAFLFFGNKLARLLQIAEIGNLIILVPLVIIFSAWTQVYQQYLIRKKQYNIRARIDIVQALLVNGTKTVVGFFKPLGACLVIIYTLGIGLYACMMNLKFRKINAKSDKDDEPLTNKSLWQLAKKYSDFPIYRTRSIFIQHFMASCPVLMLSGFFGPATAGFYALGRRMLNAPAQLIGNAVGDVFYPKISEAAQRGEKITSHIKKATIALAALGTIRFGLIAVCGPWLFGFVFGQEWVIAGEYARWISILSFFSFIDGPVKKAILVLNLQLSFLLYNTGAAFLRIVALTAGALLFHSALIAVILYSISGAFVWIMLLPYVLYKSKMKHSAHAF